MGTQSLEINPGNGRRSVLCVFQRNIIFSYLIHTCFSCSALDGITYYLLLIQSGYPKPILTKAFELLWSHTMKLLTFSISFCHSPLKYIQPTSRTFHEPFKYWHQKNTIFSIRCHFQWWFVTIEEFRVPGGLELRISQVATCAVIG